MTGVLGGVTAVAFLNLLTFAAFACDKWLARRGSRRVPEAVLLQLAFLGGSPAAKFAQRRLRHKTRKQPFARRLNAITKLHVLVLAAGVMSAAFGSFR